MLRHAGLSSGKSSGPLDCPAVNAARENSSAALPPLNPAEGVWDQLKDALGDRLFATLAALEAALIDAWRTLWECRDKVLALVSGWIHDHANASQNTFLSELE